MKLSSCVTDTSVSLPFCYEAVTDGPIAEPDSQPNPRAPDAPYALPLPISAAILYEHAGSGSVRSLITDNGSYQDSTGSSTFEDDGLEWQLIAYKVLITNPKLVDGRIASP